MKSVFTLCGWVALLSTAHAQGPPAVSEPAWPQVAAVIERLNASNSVLEVEQVLRANAALVTNGAADTLFGALLQNNQLTADQRTIVSLARETFRDARAGGIPLAAETLGVRVTLLELTAAQTEADARAVLIKRRDVTSSPHLGAALKRLAEQPDVSASTMQEIAAALREANTSPDAAIARLRRLAGSAAPSTGSTGAPTGAAAGSSAPLVGHWRCTTIVGGGDASITTDHHMMLAADGTFRSWQTSFSSFSGRESTTEPETGRWSMRGNTLIFTGVAGQPTEVPFQRSGDTILLPNESSRRIWERVR